MACKEERFQRKFFGKRGTLAGALRGTTSPTGQMSHRLPHGLKRQSAAQKRRKSEEDEWNRQRQKREYRKARCRCFLDIKNAEAQHAKKLVGADVGRSIRQRDTQIDDEPDDDCGKERQRKGISLHHGPY